MQHDRTEMHGISEAQSDSPDSRKAAPTSPPESTVAALFSTVGTATLLSLFAGVCYYYTLHYREAYLGRLGLDPAMLPITMQEAIAKGFEGIVVNVSWVVAILAVGTLAYIVLAWGGAYALQKLFTNLGISLKVRTPHPALIELGRNEGFRVSFIAALVAIGATLLGGLGAVLVGGPADAAGTRAAKALLARVNSTSGICARYELKGGSTLIGWPIGSTADRQFVLGNDNAAHVIKLDDLQRLNATSVLCQTAKTVSHSRLGQTDRSNS